uniref:Transmembrane protein n=1 Tax=Pithovirus LCPAC103 TaxID=2506588 RepID=A0A481Z5R4_9VIRU|nr:MAG: hypothetical protein LCPAC103_01300 [Pithovirus LCPAC103]
MGVVLSDIISITVLLGIGVMAAIAATRVKDDPEQARILAGIAAAIAFATAILVVVISVVLL